MSVTLERGNRDHVVHVLIDFDDLNLVTPEWTTALSETAHAIPHDASVVTLQAVDNDDEGIRGLTAGLDLNAAKDFTAHDGWDMLEGLYEAIAAVRDLDAVTICGCGDYTLGAGFELAIACDFRVATPDAVLGLPEVNVGLPTVIMGGLLIRHVGVARAKEMIYTGETLTGEEAVDLGLVTEAPPPDEYEDVLGALVDGFASKSPLVLKWQSYVFRHWRSLGLEMGMKYSIGVASRCFDTHDQREAMLAFLEDREPEFTGA